MFFFSGIIINAVLFARFSMLNPELGRVLMSLIALLLLGLGDAVLAVSINHWRHVRGAIITTFPQAHELEIKVEGAMFRLKDGDLTRISVQHNEDKLQLGFAKYYLASGESFILSNKSSGMWVVQQYFKNIPVEYKAKYLPFINT